MRTTGGIADDLRRTWLSMLEDVYVALPGRIESYDGTTRLASVQPLTQRRYKGDAAPVDLPQVPNVLIVQPRTATAQVRLPVAKGDLCMLHFTDRALANWLAGDGTAKPPLDVRMHSINDAVAYLGAWPPGAAGATDNDPTALVVQNANGVIKISAVGQVAIGQTGAELLGILDGVIAALQSAVTATAIGPQPLDPATQTTLATLKVKLTKIKGSI